MPKLVTCLNGDPAAQAAEYPATAVMFHRYSVVTAGAGILLYHEALQDFAYYSRQMACADGDTFTQALYLSAGNYTLNVLGKTTATSGKIDWYLDGVLQIAGQDWYSAATTYNVVKTGAVAVVGNGQHVLTGVVNGLNGASGDYYIELTAMALY